MQGRREQALHKYPTAGWSPVIPVLGPGATAPGGRLSQPRQRGRQGRWSPPGEPGITRGQEGEPGRLGMGAPRGRSGGPGCPEGREGVPRAAAHLVLQDADVALQEAGPDGQSRVVLAALRRAAGHRRHLLLLPPPRLRAAPADADAAVHEQQAGAHGGERQADGQPVALRGAQREPAQRAPPAAGPAGRAASPPAHPQVSPSRHPVQVRGDNWGSPSVLLLPLASPLPCLPPFPQPCCLASCPLRAAGYPAPLIPVPPSAFGHRIRAF